LTSRVPIQYDQGGRFRRIRGIIRSIQEQDQILDSWKHEKSYKIWIRYYKRKNPHIGYEAKRLKISLKGTEGKKKSKAP
jgi:hypothetical protein